MQRRVCPGPAAASTTALWRASGGFSNLKCTTSSNFILYEDNISGKLSDERFIKLSRDYELEQTNLTNLVEHLRQEVKEQEKQKVNVRQFIAAVRKYTDMQQLDASVLREFVDKIYISEVYTPDENEPRIKVREIEIVYNFIGAFDFEEAREQSQASQKEKKIGVA